MRKYKCFDNLQPTTITTFIGKIKLIIKKKLGIIAGIVIKFMGVIPIVQEL